MQSLPDDIQKLMTLLQQHAQLFLVGGCVRDMLMHRRVNDYDMAISIPPSQTMHYARLAGYRVLPTGFAHGTVSVITEAHSVEITTFRKETQYDDHRRPTQITFSESIEEDLARRDFTINAIAYHPTIGLIDPFHGVQDIQMQIIRCVGCPQQRFKEDALRILRALRFRTTLHFRIEDATWRAIQQQHEDLRYISRERVKEEVNRLLMGEEPDTLTFLRAAGVLTQMFPGYDDIYDHPQYTPWHCYNIFTHTDIALNHSVGYPLESKLAIIFHDLGKPACETFDAQGIAHYKQHALHSEQKARQLLIQLTYDKQTIERVCTLIRYHDYYVKPSRPILRRYLAKFNHDLSFALQALDIQIADDLAKNWNRSQEKIDAIHASKKLLLEMDHEQDTMKRSDMCINGHDLLAIGCEGRQIKGILQHLYDDVLNDPTHNTHAYLMQEAIILKDSYEAS